MASSKWEGKHTVFAIYAHAIAHCLLGSLTQTSSGAMTRSKQWLKIEELDKKKSAVQLVDDRDVTSNDFSKKSSSRTHIRRYFLYAYRH